MVATSLQLGDQLSIVSALPRLLAAIWSAYYVRTLRRGGHRFKGTCFATAATLAAVSTATTATTPTTSTDDIGASEKKND